MRNRSYEGREQDERGYGDRPRGYDGEDVSTMGHERGFGMANGREGGFDRDPHRVDVHRYGGRDDGMWSRYDYASEQRMGPFNRSFDARDESRGGFGVHGWRRGRLPKGYTRSDERIREDVCERLGMEVDASEVEVRVDGGIVTLTGSVGDRRSKYLLEEITERVPGVSDVQNHVTILRGTESSLPPRGPRH